VGYEKQRRNGHWTALYELRPNVYRSAGTFASRAEAEQAWREVERDLRVGNYLDPARSRWTFRRYAEEKFLPLHTGVKINTRKNYASDLRSHLLPFFGDMQLGEIYPEHVRVWVTQMQQAGYAPSTIRTRKAALSTVFSRAVADRYLRINPAYGVKTPKEPPQRIRALAPQDVPRLLAGLPGPVSRMLVELDLHTGLRWGELTELRGRDVKDDDADELRVFLDVQRAVVDAGTEFTEDGTRFYVEQTTKGGYDRKVGLSVAMTDKLLTYLEEHEVGEDDLVFPSARLRAEWEAVHPKPPRKSLADMPTDLLPAISPTGRAYRHGTPNAYDTARCRCEWCRLAKADQRASRRAEGKDRPPVGHSRRGRNVTDHCPDDWFRDSVWKPALVAAGFSRRIVFYDLRHSHATWLANSHTVDIMKLKERMGHRSILTTQRYLSASEYVDHTAADALEEYIAGAEQRAAARRRRRIKAV
jgi:integrase